MNLISEKYDFKVGITLNSNAVEVHVMDSKQLYFKAVSGTCTFILSIHLA